MSLRSIINVFFLLAATTNALFVPTSDLPKVTQQECEIERDGTVVLEIPNAKSVLVDTFYCEPVDDRPAGERPTAVVVDEAVEAVVGVCCTPPPPDDVVVITGGVIDGEQDGDVNDNPPLPLPSDGLPINGDTGDKTDELLVPDTQVSRDECVQQGGTIVGDIGNGAIFRDDYICESNGEPPIAVVIPGAGEPIAFEGEVCCGASSDKDADNSLTLTEKDDDDEDKALAAALTDKDGDDSLAAGAIVGIAVGSVAFVVAVAGLIMIGSRSSRKSQSVGKDNQSESSGTHDAANDAEDKA